MFVRLSYGVSKEQPGWPDNPTVDVRPVSSIAAGEPFNSSDITIFNHFGSHMDGPKHFNNDRPGIAELPLDRFIFEKPVMIDVPKTFLEMVTADDLKPHKEEIGKADLLMLRSGFSACRSKDPEAYRRKGPGVGSDACKYLIEGFPSLKALAVDWLSLSSYPNDDGLLAHQYLLAKYDRYICIIEDIRMEGLSAGAIKKVFAIPMFIHGIDSSPVTVIAEIEGAI